MSEPSSPPPPEAAAETKQEKPAARKRKRPKRLRGFAGMISGIMGPLNENPKFQHVYADASYRFLLVATDMPPAALIVIDDGKVTFEGVPLEDVKNTKRDGLIQCTLQQFMDLAQGKLNPVKAWVTRKIKLRGPRKLVKLLPVFGMLKF